MPSGGCRSPSRPAKLKFLSDASCSCPTAKTDRRSFPAPRMADRPATRQSHHPHQTRTYGHAFCPRSPNDSARDTAKPHRPRGHNRGGVSGRPRGLKGRTAQSGSTRESVKLVRTPGGARRAVRCLRFRGLPAILPRLVSQDLMVRTGHRAPRTTPKAFVAGICPARLPLFFAPMTIRSASVTFATRRISSTGWP